MRYGVIDIGSNTIRGVAYEIQGNKARKIEDKRVNSHILRETVDNNLTENGISRLIAVLHKLDSILKKTGCKVIGCFCTSSIRGLNNLEQVKNIIYETTGITIDVLSGQKEAEYDFVTLRMNVPERNAIGIDLGGGSCQIVQFENNKLLFAHSYEVGANRMLKRFVRGGLPTAEELRKISFFVKNEMMNVNNLFGSRYLYAMGGTARSALKLYNSLYNIKNSDGFFSIESMDKLCTLALTQPEKMYNVFTNIVKNRAETIIPGVAVLRTICEIFDMGGIYVLPSSIRDGYLIRLIRMSKRGN